MLVSEEWQARVRALSHAKALALAAYGESVAAYRYRTLSDKATTEAQKAFFDGMATEEQGHHIQVQKLLKDRFPDSDFVLTPEDKELVIVGPRLLDLSDADARVRALELIYESERLTGRFYATFHDVTTRNDLKPLMKEMAEECFEHAERLRDIPPLG